MHRFIDLLLYQHRCFKGGSYFKDHFPFMLFFAMIIGLITADNLIGFLACVFIFMLIDMTMAFLAWWADLKAHLQHQRKRSYPLWMLVKTVKWHSRTKSQGDAVPATSQEACPVTHPKSHLRKRSRFWRSRARSAPRPTPARALPL